MLLFGFDSGHPGFQFVSDHPWIESFGISWKLGVDGISLFLVVLSGILFPLAIAGPTVHHDLKGYVSWMLLLEAGCIGVFLSLDLFVFFVFWEIVLVPMYFLIGGWGYERRVYAALKFFIYTMLGSALMLVGILALVFLSQKATGTLTFDLVSLAEGQSVAEQHRPLVFLAFAASFAIKCPIFPVHTWLPDAHTEAPTGGSVILAGVLLKLGTYGFVRFGLYLFPEAAYDLAPVFLTLGVIGIVYGALVATMQTRPEAAGGLLVGGPPGVHRGGHLRPVPAGPAGRGAADGQPRHLHRRPVPPGGDDLRAPPHPPDRGHGWHPEVGPPLRRPCSPWSCSRRSGYPASTGSWASSWCCWARSSPPAGGWWWRPSA